MFLKSLLKKNLEIVQRNKIRVISCINKTFKKRFTLFLKRVTTTVLLSVLLLGDIGFLIVPFNYLQAAEVTVDSSVRATASRHTYIGAQSVFISDQVGYKVYNDSGGQCVYSKTTDGGAVWGSAVTVNSQGDCFSPSIWYDQWTPGDTGSYIHILSADRGQDDLWYNRLDTASDTLLLGSSPISTIVNSGQGGSLNYGKNAGSITKGTDGTVYMAVSDNADSYVVECSASCDLTTSWTETGTNPMELQPDFSLILPLSGGDLLLINRDISANDIRSKVWDDSAGSWSASWVQIDTNAKEKSTYDPMLDAVVNVETGDIYLAYLDMDASQAVGGDNDDINTAKYSASSWSAGTDVITDSVLGLTDVSISIDANNDDVYVSYVGRTAPTTASTANVYWATSTSDMTSWGGQQGPVNSTSDDIYGLDSNGYSDERITVTWYGITPDDIFMDTIANVSPVTVVSVTGSQTAEVRASTSDLYVGGQFIIEENITSRNVTDITINENGTVDAASALDNIKLYYDLDTSDPYDCVSESYAGGESQFGSTDTNGFSGADGASTFSGSVNISPTQAMCVYVELDVLDTAVDGSTLAVEITDPTTDVLVSGGVTAIPATVLAITGNTNIVDSVLTQTHFHWRNDDNTETLATSRTAGVQDVDLSAIQHSVPVRMRFGVSNEGSTSTLSTNLQLEYTQNVSTCAAATGWTDVGAAADEWDMSPSSHITDGASATDISVAIGGVDNENSVLLTPNGGLRDISSQLGNLTFLPTNWTELEFSVVASTTATEGNTYCFRITDTGDPLAGYTNYPRVTIAADVTVKATSTQTTNVDIPTTDFYIGGAFTIQENSSSRNVTDITITENGTVDGVTGVDNIKLYYDLDTSNPYDCVSESYVGGESQFGSTDTDGFSGSNGTSTFSGSVSISTTQAMCTYVVVDVTDAALNGETLDVTINSGSDDVLVSGGGSVSPSIALDIGGSTTLNGGLVSQTHTHWRNDDGDETASGATSATGGTEDTELTDFLKDSPVRLRVGLSNVGSTSSVPHRYGLEYGVKTSTCGNILAWTDADGGGVSWNMLDSTFITNGDDTTNISVVSGGVSDPGGKTFLTTNGGVRDTESFAATTTLTETQFSELEFSITSTEDTPYESSYCFRVTQNGEPLLQYDQYAEITIEANRDFKIQRGEVSITGASVTLTAGVDYEAPSASTSAFMRITNSHHTGSGKNASGGNQKSRDYTAYVSNSGNIETSVTISRPPNPLDDTYVDWEIVEYIGPTGGDNEIFVRDQTAISYGSTALNATGTAVSGVADDDDVVVFITGQSHNGGNRTEVFAHQSTANWSTGSSQPVFTRGDHGANPGNISYAIVEFSGINWKIQRAEHAYSLAGTAETESITAVNSLSRTFLHTQKRYSSPAIQADVGHEVWLSSIGAVSFLIANNADAAVNHYSVAWVIENTQTGGGASSVQRSSGNTNGGSEPFTLSVPISTPVNAANNASIFTMTKINQTGSNLPRPFAGAYITSSTTYQVWRSDTGGSDALSYRTEIVQWPVADLAVRQNYYRFYADNGALKPTDPWPAGATDLGENTTITATDEPLSDAGHIRLRMTAKIVNATLPAGFEDVKLQYGLQDTTCSAIVSWTDLGGIGSGAIWRGYDSGGIADGVSVSGNPPTVGDLVISVSDVAGRYVEEGSSPTNEFKVLKNEDIEYDWHIQQNGAPQKTNYCFRMIRGDDTELDAYFNYPVIRTEGYAPATQDWRWYDDETNETPATPIADENVSPVDLDKGSIIKLRVTVTELKNLTQLNARFKLQYSEFSDFSSGVYDIVSTTSCADSSIWCYADAAGVDNVLIDEKVLSGSDACVGGVGNGCGVHNESSIYLNGFEHTAGRKIENEYTLKYTNVIGNFGKVYYFRLYDLANDEPVVVNTGYSIPSTAGKSALLTFTVSGVNSGVNTAGIVTDITTSPTSIGFDLLAFNSSYEAAQKITIDTNAVEGYQVMMYSTQQLTGSFGDTIPDISSTNISPTGWLTACTGVSSGCFGYHTTDATLDGGSARFGPTDSYSAFSTAPEEIMYSSSATVDVHDVVYRISVTEDQLPGDYETSIVYISTPIY